MQNPSGDALSLLNYSVATNESVVQAVKLSSVVFRVNKLNVSLCRPTQAGQHRANLAGQHPWEGRRGPGWHDCIAPVAGKPAPPQDTQRSLRAFIHLGTSGIAQGHFILSEESLLEEHEVSHDENRSSGWAEPARLSCVQILANVLQFPLVLGRAGLTCFYWLSWGWMRSV